MIDRVIAAFSGLLATNATAVGMLPGPSASSSGNVQASAYPVQSSMSTLARFPWMWVAIRAIASDLAGLPLIATPQGGGDGRTVDDPALRILANPSAGCQGRLFRMQLLTDFLATGDAYFWRKPGGSLVRLHPMWVTALADDLGNVIHWIIQPSATSRFTLPPSELIHVRDISWDDGPGLVYGESPVRALHDDLVREMSGRQLGADQSTKGHPDVIFSVKGAGGRIKAREMSEEWETARQAKRSAFVVYDDVSVTPLSWTPEQMALGETSDRLRDTILAMFEVPPARAGVNTANYGTQRQQMRTYWESLIRRSVAFDEAFSQLARPGVRISHDFSAVESLQVSYSERLARVEQWVALGATPADAARYEGFADAPLPQGAVPAAVAPRPGAGDEAPEPPRGGKGKSGESLRVRVHRAPRPTGPAGGANGRPRPPVDDEPTVRLVMPRASPSHLDVLTQITQGVSQTVAQGYLQEYAWVVDSIAADVSRGDDVQYRIATERHRIRSMADA